MLSTLFPPDPTLTVDNVNRVMEKVEPKVKTQVWVGASSNKRKELSGNEDECADWYVNCNPYSSWEYIARSLYHHHQVAAVEEVRSYLPPRGEPDFIHASCYVKYYNQVLIMVHLWIGIYLIYV